MKRSSARHRDTPDPRVSEHRRKYERAPPTVRATQCQLEINFGSHPEHPLGNPLSVSRCSSLRFAVYLRIPSLGICGLAFTIPVENLRRFLAPASGGFH